jgi:hypothetical protein
MDARTLWKALDRDPKGFPLFSRLWEVLNMAPSSKHADEEEIISLTWDAFDYLQASGTWSTASTTGRTEMSLTGNELVVKEDDDKDYKYEHRFNIH